MKRSVYFLGTVCLTLSLLPGMALGQPDHNPLTPSLDERVFCDVCSVLRPDLLPADRQIEPPKAARCGTALLMEAMSHWDRLQPSTRAKLTTLFQRPSNQRSYTSPTGHFMIHYDLTGSDAVDTSDSNGDGIPDYVELVAESFDHARDREVNELGYLPPPDDGDGVYDIHIQQLGLQGVYGLAWSDQSQITSDSYIQIDNNFTDNIYATRGSDGVQVTAAHEYFHAIQFAYFTPFSAAWWQELTATWMEDVIYDDINDYYQYQMFFFQDPETSLDDSPFAGLQPFAASVFAHHLEQVYGRDLIRATWESLGTREPSVYDITDIEVALPGGFSSVLPRFAVWNYLTGTRHVGSYYEEGAQYTEINPRQITVTPGVMTSGSARIDHLASTYLSVNTRSLSGGLRVSLSLESGSTYEVVMMLMKNGVPEVVSWAGTETTIANVSRYDEVVVIPVSTSTSGDRFDIGYSVTNATSVATTSDLVGDFDRDGSVAFSDFLSFAESFGKLATDAGHVRQHDLNADGDIGFGDFLIFAGHFGESR